MLNTKEILHQKHKNTHRHEHDHEHEHEHTHSHDEVKISRRGVIKWLAVSIGLAASATILPSVVQTRNNTSTEQEISDLKPERIYNVNPSTLHKPKSHYCRLKVFMNKLRFEKSCCVSYAVKQILINGQHAPYKQKDNNPLVVDMPKAKGTIEIVLYVKENKMNEMSYVFYV